MRPLLREKRLLRGAKIAKRFRLVEEFGGCRKGSVENQGACGSLELGKFKLKLSVAFEPPALESLSRAEVGEIPDLGVVH